MTAQPNVFDRGREVRESAGRQMLEEVEPVEMAYGEVTRRVRVRAESIAPDPSPHEGDRREERPGRRGRVPRLGEATIAQLAARSPPRPSRSVSRPAAR